MNTNHTISCLRPINLGIDHFLETTPPAFSYKREVFLYLFDLWIEQFSWRDKEDLLADNNFVPLHSQKMKAIRYDYEKYIKYLLETGIWETDGLYQVSQKSKGYKFSDAYLTQWVEEKLPSTKFTDHIAEIRGENRALVATTYPGILDWFDGLEIDKEQATQWVDDWYTGCYTNNLIESEQRLLQLRKNCYLRSIHKITNKDYSFNIDPRSGRLFSVLTNMKKELRSYLSYRGEKLVCIDLSNSQPFLALLLMNLDFYSAPNDDHTGIVTLSQLSPYVQKELASKVAGLREDIVTLGKFEYGKAYWDVNCQCSVDKRNDRLTCGNCIHDVRFLPLCGAKADVNGQPMNDMHDAALYCYHVRKGSFYESIRAIMPAGRTKQDAKKTSLTIFFADDTDTRGFFRQNRELFNRLYPNVYQLFRKIKEKDYTLLSILLQNVEAELFFNRICKRFHQKYPAVPIFTIHDSVCTTIQHEALLQSIIVEEITKAVSVQPNIKTERWSTSNELVL